jgi:prefoldin subunit 5
MNLRERAACDGLDDSSIAETMAWLKDACERLEWEIYSASNELHAQASKLTKLEAEAEESK